MGAYLRALVVEALQEALQQLVGVVDALGVLAHDPDHGGARVRLVQGVQVLTQRGDDALVPGGAQGSRGEGPTLNTGPPAHTTNI